MTDIFVVQNDDANTTTMSTFPNHSQLSAPLGERGHSAVEPICILKAENINNFDDCFQCNLLRVIRLRSNKYCKYRYSYYFQKEDNISLGSATSMHLVLVIELRRTLEHYTILIIIGFLNNKTCFQTSL